MNLDQREQDTAIWAAWTGVFVAIASGLAGCFQLTSWTGLAVLLAAITVAFALRVLALPAAIAMLIGWPLVVVGFGLQYANLLVVAFALPAIWASWKYRRLAAEERWRLVGMERFWRNSQRPWTLQDAASHAAWGTGLMAASTSFDLITRGDWGSGLALGGALGVTTWGLRNRAGWAVIVAIVVVPISIWMARDGFAHWSYTACYLAPAAWVAVRLRRRTH